MRIGKQKNTHLQASWNEYGEKAFTFEVLELCEPEKCLEREEYWVDFHKALDRKFGYNKVKPKGGMLGYRMTPEQRLHNSRVHKGLKRPLYAILATAEAKRGGKHSEETKAHWSRIRKGRKQSAETVAKRVAKLRGRKRSEEQKAKMKAFWEKRRRERLEAKALQLQRGQLFDI